MTAHEELIAGLSRDLEPVAPPPNLNALAVVWLAMSAGFVVTLTHLVGPIRPGAFAQLASNRCWVWRRSPGPASRHSAPPYRRH